MKYMGWSEADYWSASTSTIERIIERMVDEHERRLQEQRRAESRRR